MNEADSSTIADPASPSPQLLRLVDALRRNAPGPEVPVAIQRADFEAAVANFRMPAGVTRQSASAGGVPAEWLEPAEASRGVLLWLHGGGYSVGSLNTVRPLSSNLAVATGCRVLAIDYRLAPEHPLPAAVDDAVSAYQWLLDAGVDPADLAIGGDSAGGGLAAATLLAARDKGLPLPAAAIFVSPWADLTLRAGSLFDNDDPQFLPGQLEAMSARYLGGQDPAHPYASPVLADLTGFPPMLIHVGTREALRDDSFALAKAGERAGVSVTLDARDHVVHVWHAFAPVLPEATAALESLGGWLRSRLRSGSQE